MLIQTRPPDHASLAVPLCNPTPDGKTSETPHFGFAVLPRQLGSRYSSLEHFKRQELLGSFTQTTCRFGLSLSSDNGVKAAPGRGAPTEAAASSPCTASRPQTYISSSGLVVDRRSAGSPTHWSP